jgi:hypothetical protein
MIMFDNEWMGKFKDVWNASAEVSEALAKINFDSTIAWGIAGDDKPRGVLVVKGGKAVQGGAYNGEHLNWDLRASQKHWDAWQQSPMGMAGLGMAVATGKLKFIVGDYGSMLKNPAMATPFVNSFGLLQKVK